MDSSREIFGTRSMLGEIVPSCISGMKEVPRYGNNASEAAYAASATVTVFFSLCVAHRRIAVYGRFRSRTKIVSCSFPPFNKYEESTGERVSESTSEMPKAIAMVYASG